MIRFLSEALVIRMHDYVISKYGGAYGVLDAAALDSALNAPKLQFHFLHSPIPHLAATYGFHLCQNHPFLEGNKRTAHMAMLTFLGRNGFKSLGSEYDHYYVMLEIANSRMSKSELVDWLYSVVRQR